MLVMLREIVGSENEERDRTINPKEVLSVKETFPGNNWSVLKMTDGTEINVRGSVIEVTKRLNGAKRLLKG